MLPNDFQRIPENRPEVSQQIPEQEPQKQPRLFLTPKQWIGMVIGWFVITFTVFALSEIFKDTWVIYPSVFILILFSLIGPGVLGATVPPEIVPLGSRLRPILPFLAYIICLVSVRLFYRLGVMLHWF